MASRSRSEKRSDAGGYNNEFVHSPPDSLCCGVCTLPYREPHLLGCCGKKICESCIDYVRKSSKPCPYCNQTISSMLDKELRSKVLDMAVYCSYKSRGCDWTGEMRRLQRHVMEDCKCTGDACRYRCGVYFLSSHEDERAEHETEECPKRPLEVQFKSLERRMSSKIEEYESRISRLEAEMFCPPCKLVMDDYYGRTGTVWLSLPFFSSPDGYKMCLAVHNNTGRDGKYLTIFVHLRKGNYDSQLYWPFQGRVKIEIMNWDGNNMTNCVIFDQEAFAQGAADRVTHTDGKGIGWYNSNSPIRHSKLESISPDYCRYINNEAITFIITDIVI